jgi:hypothetical protein
MAGLRKHHKHVNLHTPEPYYTHQDLHKAIEMRLLIGP